MGAAEKRIESPIVMTRAELDKLLRDAATSSPWLLLAEAAAYCKMSPDALQKAVERGRLKPDSRARPGRSKLHRFKKETLDRFLEDEDQE